MTWPKLSIVVYANADPGGCVRLLASCERLNHEDLEFEVILVLQGLTDKVQTVFKDYEFSFDLKLVATDATANRAAGRNRGVAEAQHEIILFLDSALEVSPELLFRHLEIYEDQETAAVMGELFLPKFVKKSSWFRFLDSDYRSTRRWAAAAGTNVSPPLRYVNTANFSVRKDLYIKSGGHNEFISHHEAEDIDLAHRISALDKGVIRYHPEAVAFCQHPPLKTSLKSKFDFGQEGIPKLLEAYPDLYSLLPSRFVKMTGFPSIAPLKRGLMNLAFTPPIMLIARGLRLLTPDFISFRMMRYMLQYESVRGVKSGS